MLILLFANMGYVNAQDNLGNHTATQNLNMNNKIVDNARHVDIKNVQEAGVRFWGVDSYKISMSKNNDYKYGPVKDYSIKCNMNNNPDRGWTWGIVNQVPVAALNTEGTMQLKNNMYVMGNVGIGNNNPKADLHVGNRLTLGNGYNPSNDESWTWIGHNWLWNQSLGRPERVTSGPVATVTMNGRADIVFYTAPTGNAGVNLQGSIDPKLTIKNDGRVEIGDGYGLAKRIDGTDISKDSYRLFVDKGILTEKVKVALTTTADWADYVFEEDYDLNAIEEVEDFVKENKHLPNIPSAEEMVNNGLNIAEMDAKLLRQIEELWLHTIQTNKRNNDLEAQLEDVIKQNNELSKRLEKLEK